jgi:hypothetical protein
MYSLTEYAAIISVYKDDSLSVVMQHLAETIQGGEARGDEIESRRDELSEDYTDTGYQGPRVQCTLKQAFGLGCCTDAWRCTPPRCNGRVEEGRLTESGERCEWLPAKQCSTIYILSGTGI